MERVKNVVRTFLQKILRDFLGNFLRGFLREFLRNTPFQRQLSITVSVGVMCIALFSALFSAWQGSRQIHATLLEQGQKVAENLANNSTLALLYASADNANEVVNTTLSFPDITRVEIRTPHGAALIVRGPAESDMPEGTPPTSALRQPYLETETNHAWRFIAPVFTKRQTASPFEVIENPGEWIGYVRVVQSKATLARMKTHVFLSNLAISFFFAFIFLLVIRILANRLTQPITALSKVMTSAEHGASNLQAKLAGSKDIVDMAKAFNRMIAVLQEREQAVRDSQERYREVIENVREVIFQTDIRGLLTFLNPAWLEVTGYPIETTLGTPLSSYIEASGLPQFELWQRRLQDSAAPADFRYETRFKRSNNSIGWIGITQRPRLDHNGILIGTSGTLDDITDRKIAEQQLKTLNAELENRVLDRTAELEASNRDLEAFSYSVSHDLRAPLRGISGFAYILQEDYSAVLDEKGCSHIARIRAAAHRMGDLIDDLIELARINRAALYHQTVDLSAQAHEIVAEFREAEPQRQVEIFIAENLSVQADPMLMRGVLENLLSNAWKFSAKQEHSKITFDSEIQDDMKIFFVRDNGAGFDMAHAGSLFQPFNRLHHAEAFSGTGIGLATVLRVIQRHGGEIWAEAEVGQGATFYFTIPDLE